METVAISYRVADFLKKHPPFHAMDEADLVDLAGRGRVRFHEANDFVLWQGEPHRAHVFVIQQGTVSVWDEASGRTELRDMLGAGDMLGIERFNGAPSCAYSARAGSDVVLYTFPADDFAGLLEKYPHALQYVAAHSGVTDGYAATGPRREPHDLLLHDLVERKTLHTCPEDITIRDAARQMLAGADAIAIVGRDQRTRAIVTPHDLLVWIARDESPAGQPIGALALGTPGAAAPDAPLTDGVLALAASQGQALAITTDGTPGGQLHAILSARDVEAVFGDQPVSILRGIDRAPNLPALRALNLRARAFILQHLTGPLSIDWLMAFAHTADVKILDRIIGLAPQDATVPACWCFCGAAGRTESVTLAAPAIALILEKEGDREAAEAMHRHVLAALVDCGYLAPPEGQLEPSSCIATAAGWKARYRAWVRDPVLQQTYRARPLFDLRPVIGSRPIWHDLAMAVDEAVDRNFLHVLANDCLANLPPLTFFQDAVIEDTGEFASVFRLAESVLCPLVDVGRVLGMAAGSSLGRSTLERLALARGLFADQEFIFREAAEALRIVLGQQGRIGIDQGTDGSELPPALLSRQDRHLLKGSFRSIHRLIQFTADPAWIRAL